MKAATHPRDRSEVKMLVINRRSGSFEDHTPSDIPRLLDAGDVLVLNDAATIPASLPGHTASGHTIEVRLVRHASPDLSKPAREMWGVIFGEGDWRQRTEDRPPPPPLVVGEELMLGELSARVVEISTLSARLIRLCFDRSGPALWRSIYRYGHPIQYSYLREPLALWSVQTVYASRPTAFEMPSAGRPLTHQILRSLRDKGVDVVTLTHAAGLSSTGDSALDRALPLPESYEIPVGTVQAIRTARGKGRRVIAMGTTVVRALEGAAMGGGLVEGPGITDLRMGPGFVPSVVTDLITGMHVRGESHFELSRAFLDEWLLDAAARHADALGYEAHEFGDLTWIRSDRGVADSRARDSGLTIGAAV